MKKILTSIILVVIIFALCSCQFLNPNIIIDNGQDREYIGNITKVDFQNSCRYNIYLYPNVPIEHIGVPIFIEYQEIGQKVVDDIISFDFEGENLEGLNVNVDDILFKWTFYNPENEENGVHVKAYNVSITTNDDYRFSADPRKINQFTFRIYNYEYVVPVDIKIHDQKDYMGIYHNFKKVSIFAEPIGIEIPALNQEWRYFGKNFIVKDFFAADQFYELTVDRYKKYQPIVTDEGVTRNVIRPVHVKDISTIRIDDYAYMELDLKPNPKTQRVVCSGDMFILQLQNPQTQTLTNLPWGLYSRIDFCEARELVDEYFRYKNSLPPEEQNQDEDISDENLPDEEEPNGNFG